VQRVLRARVLVDSEVTGEIGPGLCVLLGVAETDDETAADRLAGRVARLRILENEYGKFDRSIQDEGGGALVVSQFTLAGSLSKGNRPSFDRAEAPERAEDLYLRVAEGLRGAGLPVATGRFGADMAVELVNDGPVTFLVVTKDGALVK